MTNQLLAFRWFDEVRINVSLCNSIAWWNTFAQSVTAIHARWIGIILKPSTQSIEQDVTASLPTSRNHALNVDTVLRGRSSFGSLRTLSHILWLSDSGFDLLMIKIRYSWLPLHQLSVKGIKMSVQRIAMSAQPITMWQAVHEGYAMKQARCIYLQVFSSFCF